ncbi:hypothetical protein PAPYR_8206 [Paratrimastix pyriformis]|uniref:Uncharacterized protein n=1 Tax=Paratrimastix pyriformis TaxID=342808 RepID=A0ABQ8UGW3_9EUKA|nr:hypothetical protein PAPYR_8206 [Paratrimastix pyriformis]
MCRWLFFLCVSLGLTLAPLTSKSWGQNCFGVAVDPPSGAAISTTQQFNISFVLHGVEPPFQWNLGAPLIYAGISQSKGVQLRSSTGNIYLPSSLTKTSDYWFLVKFQNLPTATDFGLIIHNIITSKQRFNLGPIGWANYTTNPDPLPSSPGPTELEDCPVPSRDPWWIGLPPEPSFTLSPSIVLEETLWTLRLEFNFSSDSPFSWNLSSFIYHNEIYELQSPLQGTLRAASIEQSIPLVRTGVYQPAHEGVNMDGAYFDMYQVTSRDEIQAILDGTLNPFFLDTFEVSLNTGSTWSAYSNSSSATEMLLRAEGLESLSNYTARFGSPAIYIQWLSGQWSIGYDTVFSCPKGSPRNLMCPHCPIVYHALEYFSSVPALRVVTPLLFEAAGFDFGNASVTKEMFFSLNGTSYDNAELIVTPEFEARFIFDLDDAVFHERQLLYPVTNFTGFFVEGATLRNMLFVPKTYFGHSLNHIGVAPWTWLAQASCDEAQGSGLGFQISSLYHGGSAYRAEVLRHFDSLKANASMDRIALNDSVLRLRYSQVPLRAEIHLRQPLIKQAILEAQPGIVVVEDARTARIQWRIINVGEVGTIPNFLVVCDEGLVAEPLTIGGLLLPGEDATLSLTVRPGGGEGNLTCKATAWPTARELDTRTNTSSAWSLEVWGDSLFPSALFGLAVTNVTLAGQQLLIAGHVNNSGSTTSGTADLHCNGTISASAALSLPLGSTAISFSVPTAGLTGTLLCTVRVWMASQQASDALVTTFTASVPPPEPALFGLAVTNVTLAGQQLLIAGHVNNSGSTTSGTADLHCNGTISASAALSLPLGSTAISFSVPTAGLTGTLLCTVRVWMASQQASDALVTTFTASVPPPEPALFGLAVTNVTLAGQQLLIAGHVNNSGSTTSGTADLHCNGTISASAALSLPLGSTAISFSVPTAGLTGTLLCTVRVWMASQQASDALVTTFTASVPPPEPALFGLAVTNVTLAGQQLLIAGHVNNSGSTTSGTADLHCNGTISASAALSLPLGSTAISFSVPTAGLTGTLLCTVRVWMASQQASDALVTTFTASVPPPDPDCSPQPLLFFTLPVWSSGPSAHAISSAFNISSTVFWVLSTPQLHLSGFLVNAGDPDAEILLNISCATIPTYLEHYSTPGRSAVAFSAAFSLNPSLYGTSISCHIGASIPHPHTCWTLGTAVTTTFDAPLQSPDFFFQMPLSFWLASLPTVPTIFSAAENPFHLQVLSTSSSLSFNGYVHNRGTVAAPYSLELVCEPPAQVLSFSKSTLAPPGAHSSFSFSVSLTTTNSSCQLALLSAPSSGLAPFGKNLTQQFSLLAASPWNVSLLQPPTSHPGSYQRTFVQSNVTLEIQNQLLIPTPLRSFCDCGEMPFQCDLSTLPLSLEPNQRLPVSFVVKAPLSSSGSHLCTLNLARDDATSHPLSVPFIPSFGCGEDFIEPFLGQPRIWWSSHSDDFAVSCTFNTTVSNLFQTVVVCPVANFGLDLVAVNATFMCDSPAAAVLTGPLVRLIPSFSIESFVFGVETSQSMALHSLSCSFTVNVTDTHPCWSPSGKAARSSLELTLPCGNVSEALLAFPLATWKSLGTGHIFDSTDNPLALQITPRKGSTWVDFSFFVQNYGSGFANGFLNITCPNGTTGTALTIAPQSVQRVTLALVMVQSAECLAVASVSSGPCDSPFGKLLSQRFNFTLTSTIDSSGALPQAVLPIVISASAGVFAVFLAFGGFATARYFLTKRRFARTRGFLHATLMVDRDPE